jgi:hypothetical protein
MADSEVRRVPWLAEPFKAGATGFIVVVGAVLAEIIGGAVTNQMSTQVVVPVLVIPVAVVLGFAAVQWWQVRTSGAEPASWWHLIGIGAGLLTWIFFPTQPGVLDGVGNATAACVAVGASLTPGCLPIATHALRSHDIAWYTTAALIVAMALPLRRSRIAAYAAIPIAFAGCDLASHFMEQLILLYNAGS